MALPLWRGRERTVSMALPLGELAAKPSERVLELKPILKHHSNPLCENPLRPFGTPPPKGEAQLL